MSLTSGPINEVEQAGEKFTDHAAQHFQQSVPIVSASAVEAAAGVLTKYELVIRMTLEKKQ